MQDGGNILVFFSHWWDLEQYQQIIERIGPTRQIQAGHNRPVFIHHIIAAGTMDEMVMERRNSKRTVQDILLDAMVWSWRSLVVGATALPCAASVGFKTGQRISLFPQTS